jgi:WD40 repeat protein
VQCAVFSSDGKRVFSTSTDGTVRAWDSETGEEIRRYNHQGPVEYALPVGDDRRLLVRWTRMLTPWETPGHSSQEDWASVWDVETGREIKQVRHGRFTVSPDGKRILMAARSTTLSDAATGEVIRQYYPPPRAPAVTDEALSLGRGRLTSACFSADGKRVLTVSTDSSVRLWDAETGKEMRRFENPDRGPVIDAALSADAKRVLAKWRSRHFPDTTTFVSWWDAETGRQIKQLKLRPNSDIAIFSPDGKKVLTTTERTAVWDANTGKLVGSYE